MCPSVRKFACWTSLWWLAFNFFQENRIAYDRGHEIWHQPKQCTITISLLQEKIPTKLPIKFRVGGWFTNPFGKICARQIGSWNPTNPGVNMSSHHAHAHQGPPPGYTKITRASSEPPNAAKTPRSLKEQPKTPQQNHLFGWYGSGIVWEAYYNIIRGSLIIGGSQ